MRQTPSTASISRRTFVRLAGLAVGAGAASGWQLGSPRLVSAGAPKISARLAHFFPTTTPFQSLRGATGAPGPIATPPPTAAASGPLRSDSIPLFALLICFVFSVIALAIAELHRRSVRR